MGGVRPSAAWSPRRQELTLLIISTRDGMFGKSLPDGRLSGACGDLNCRKKILECSGEGWSVHHCMTRSTVPACAHARKKDGWQNLRRGLCVLRALHGHIACNIAHVEMLHEPLRHNGIPSELWEIVSRTCRQLKQRLSGRSQRSDIRVRMEHQLRVASQCRMQHFGLIHVVAFEGKLNKRLLLDKSWSRTCTMEKFRARPRGSDVRPLVLAPQDRIGLKPHKGADALVLLHWVDATSP